MIFLRKSVFCSLIVCLCFGLFIFSGCGGSADSSSSSSESTALPNNEPDTYNTAEVLNGSWDVIDQEIAIDVDYGDSVLNMYLTAASLAFTGTELAETKGTSTVTFHESWRRVLVNGDSRTYMGIMQVNLDNQRMKMAKSGADNWRCELPEDDYETVLNIKILAENMLQVTEDRLADIDGSSGIEYHNVMTFRKK